jgi:hypothetical protein
MPLLLPLPTRPLLFQLCDCLGCCHSIQGLLCKWHHLCEAE